MQLHDSTWTRKQIEADLLHLQFVMGRIEDTVYITADDMRLRGALRWAMARKRRILDRVTARAAAAEAEPKLS